MLCPPIVAICVRCTGRFTPCSICPMSRVSPHSERSPLRLSPDSACLLTGIPVRHLRRGFASLTLTLPRGPYAQGGKVSGRLQMHWLESFEADNVRAVLLRIENVPLGDDHTVYVDGWDQAASLFHGERRPGGQGTTYVWLESDVGLE